MPICTGCCSSCSGRSGRRRQRSPQRLGAEVACPPRLPRRAARPVSRPARRAHAPRSPRDHPLGRQPQRHPARDARRPRGPPPRRRRVAGADGLDQRPRDGHPRRLGRRLGDVHRHRVRRRGRRPDRSGGPRVRRDRRAADRRRRVGDAPLARRASARTAATGLCRGRLRAQRRPDRRAVRRLQLAIPLQCRTLQEDDDVRVHRRSRGDGVTARAGTGGARTHRAPDGEGGLPQRRRDLAGPGEGVRRDARALRRRLRRGDVLGRGVVVQPGQAAAEGQLHHPAGPSGGRAGRFPDRVGASTIPTASTG